MENWCWPGVCLVVLALSISKVQTKGHAAYVPQAAIKQARQEALGEVLKSIVYERRYVYFNDPLRDTPFAQVAAFKGGDLVSKLYDSVGRIQTRAYQKLLKSYQAESLTTVSSVPLSDQGSMKSVNVSGKMEVMDASPFMSCPVTKEIPKCDDTTTDRIRTMDGSCNNKANPHWGMSNMPLLRSLPSEYGDGVSSLRRAKSGNELPSARLVSLKVHTDVSFPVFITMNFMSIGQFLDHDMGRTPVVQMSRIDEHGNETVGDLECGKDGCKTGPPDTIFNECVPVIPPPNDPIYSGKKCHEFVRSSSAPNKDCKLGPRQQLNTITAYLDLSTTYGNTEKDAKELRDPDTTRGKLLMEQNPLIPSSLASRYKPLLPRKDVKKCRDVDDVVKCFKAGDGRMNEQVGLISLHLYFAREHNRIEEELHRLNPSWSGEKLYQEARKINIAQWQFIVYNEYMPLVLGEKLLNKFRLRFERGGKYSNGYDPSVNVGIHNVFSTAAFRFGHSQIPATLRRSYPDHSIMEDIKLSEIFRRPRKIYEYELNGADSIILGGVDQEAEEVDRHMTEQVDGRMFAENPPHGVGMDLAVLNTQRGRDHGLQGYNAWREKCGGRRAVTWYDFLRDPNPEFNLPLDAVLDLKQIYEHPDDVDIFAGGLIERKLPGTSVGPTFACIIGEQFERLKHGDRFWFEEWNGPRFTREQLRQIKKASFARIYCDNADEGSIVTIQPMTMLLPYKEAILSPRYRGQYAYDLEQFYRTLGKRHPGNVSPMNARVSCSRLPKVDLNAWGPKKQKLTPRRSQKLSHAYNHSYYVYNRNIWRDILSGFYFTGSYWRPYYSY